MSTGKTRIHFSCILDNVDYPVEKLKWAEEVSNKSKDLVPNNECVY